MIYPADKEYLNHAVSLLKEGEIIVYPTDTLYGFGVDATNCEAIKAVNILKCRTQPQSIVLANISEIEKYAAVPPEIMTEINKLLPGPYTVLLDKLTGINISPLVTWNSDKIGIRIPDHPFPLSLVKESQLPITTTSINRHNKEPLNDVTQIELDFPNVEIFEDHDLKNSLGSTIIDFTMKKPEVIRKGDGIFPL